MIKSPVDESDNGVDDFTSNKCLNDGSKLQLWGVNMNWLGLLIWSPIGKSNNDGVDGFTTNASMPKSQLWGLNMSAPNIYQWCICEQDDGMPIEPKIMSII